MPLILGSASPRRRAFFEDLGIPVSFVAPPSGAEPAPLPGEQPVAFAIRAACAKSASLLSVLHGRRAGGFFFEKGEPGAFSPAPGEDEALEQRVSVLPGLIGVAVDHSSDDSLKELGCAVITADTIVTLDGVILGKPRDTQDAGRMLRMLAGREHSVMTGCSLRAPSGHVCFACRTRVRMWGCDDRALRAYAASGEPEDKAGAYAIQGTGAFLVESVEGSWSNVVGLPLAEVLQVLMVLGCLAYADCT